MLFNWEKYQSLSIGYIWDLTKKQKYKNEKTHSILSEKKNEKKFGYDSSVTILKPRKVKKNHIRNVWILASVMKNNESSIGRFSEKANSIPRFTYSFASKLD